MAATERDEVRRAIEGRAVKVRLEVANYQRELERSPFWRFRHRRAVGKALAAAARHEQRLRDLAGSSGPDEVT